MYFANHGEPVNSANDIPWELLFEAQITCLNLSKSYVYNKMKYLKHAVIFVNVLMKKEFPTGYIFHENKNSFPSEAEGG